MLQKLVNILIKKTLFELHEFGYSDANDINIWATSMYTVQLQWRLEDALHTVDNYKELVRRIIEANHLRVVKEFPHLKEY